MYIFFQNNQYLGSYYFTGSENDPVWRRNFAQCEGTSNLTLHSAHCPISPTCLASQDCWCSVLWHVSDLLKDTLQHDTSVVFRAPEPGASSIHFPFHSTNKIQRNSNTQQIRWIQKCINVDRGENFQPATFSCLLSGRRQAGLAL